MLEIIKYGYVAIDRHGEVQFKCFESLGKYLANKF